VGGTGSPGSRGGMWEKGEVAHTMYIHVNKCKNDKNNMFTHKKEKNCSDEVLFSCIPHMPVSLAFLNYMMENITIPDRFVEGTRSWSHWKFLHES
jgi:hypothetical protein